MNPCKFIGCSIEERAGFQKIQVTVKADFENATPAEQADWLAETENRRAVTDNIEVEAGLKVSINKA